MSRTAKRPDSALRRVFSGGVWNAASELLPMVATLALSVVAARVLGPDELGRQSLIAFTEAAITSLLVNSFTEATIRTLAAMRGADDEVSAARIRRWSMAAHVASGLLTATLLAAIGLARPEQRLSWFIVAISALLSSLGWAICAQIVPDHGWRPVAVRRLGAQLAAPLLGIVAVVAGGGVPGIFAANAIAASGLLWALMKLKPRRLPVGWGPLPRALGALSAGFALYEVTTQVVAKRIEFVFLAAFSSATEVAMYSIPFMVVSAAAVAPLAIAAASMPEVAAAVGAGDRDRAVARFSWALRMASVASLPLTALLAAVGPPVVELAYGPAYHRAASLVPLASLALVIVPVGQLCISYWAGVGRLRPLIVIGGVGGAVDLVVAALLIPRHGATGAVLANLAGQATTSGALVWVTLRTVGHVELRLDRWCTAALAAGAGTIAFHLVDGLEGPIGLLLALVAGAAVFLLVAGPMGVIRRDDAELLAAVLPRPAGPLLRIVTCR